MTILPRLKPSDLAALPDDGNRYELLEGVLYVSPAPSARHQSVAMHLSAWLYTAQDRALGRAFAAPTDTVLGPDTVVQPDLVFVRRNGRALLTDANIQGPPDLVIEILSPATRERDLGAKRQLYARFGVPHYWIVDPETHSVHCFALAGDPHYGDPVTVAGSAPLELPFGPPQPLPVSTLFS